MKNKKANWQMAKSKGQNAGIILFANCLLPFAYLNRYSKLIPFILLFTLCEITFAQSTAIDEVVAVVGNSIVKKSDVEKQYAQYIAQGNTDTGDLRCVIIENLLLQKLLLEQAIIDSVQVTDAQVESELDKRIRYFVKQI